MLSEKENTMDMIKSGHGRRLTALLLACALLMPPSVRATGEQPEEPEKTFIKWVDFTVPLDTLNRAYHWDVKTYEEMHHVDWIELLAILAATTGDIKRVKKAELEEMAQRLANGETPEEIAAKLKYYGYYREAYTAVLGGLVGAYRQKKEGESGWTDEYGLKGFSPIAHGFGYSHYDDFGVSRGYGYKRRHLGHDMMCSTGTPVIAVESGVVEALGWNQYGGWRVGIRSLDGKRYYYYAHLRADRPYAEGLEQGATVSAGDVIGYVGRTGYSREENKSNINQPHLHWGLQLIFDESQKEGPSEIWVDVYALSLFLQKNQSAVYRTEDKEYHRKTLTEDIILE